MTPLETTISNLEYVVEMMPLLAKRKPSILSGFNMSFYGCMDNKEFVHECRTQGCMIGNMVHLFEPVESDFSSDRRFSYINFQRRLFPTIESAGFEFLFGSHWKLMDNSFDGAIERIKYYLKYTSKIESRNFKYSDFKLGWYLKQN